MADTVYWGLFLAVIFLWSGLNDQDPIKALSMEIKKSQALYVACAFYLFVNLFILMHFFRIGDILRCVDAANLSPALTKLFTHKWVANPFAYYGNTRNARIHGSSGFGLLIIVWWIGNASLYALTDTIRGIPAYSLQGVFLVIGSPP